MKFQVHDLGYLNGGEIVEITLLGNAANVKLMDNLNFSNYKLGRNHKYYGGYITHSPYRVLVPNSGRWYITVDLGGYSGTVRSSIRIIH
ncbi:DUF1883 domain-containing protein [Chryseobacterium mucoviscidosis]|uniref:DUF1883 domain-containing protein n=1 Tax=Chryseobacterium mucoviscidosis TaxID=1945581 RepID=A0A202CDU7_9FLAO|nr:DUF1883 domain-containing protein [Chryseobacterium mucoviscidosis]OVE61794.1 hypothetical protein B0E34_02100 [Chryseobacterium mucoviscidosis]